ncbi:hypothetical protein SAMN05428988_1918 [Chitinophaga sp. YR573]|nr:hypothetical protein SAMN05428988_1918 [Chitinophaga sp. YR573]
MCLLMELLTTITTNYLQQHTRLYTDYMFCLTEPIFSVMNNM